MDRLNSRRGIDLAHVEGIQHDTLGQTAVGVVARPREPNRTKTQNHLGATSGTAGNGRQVEKELIGDRQAVEMGEQMAAVGQHPIGLGADQQFDLGRSSRKSRIEIAFAIGDDGDRDGAGLAQEGRRLGAHQPAAGLFLIRRALRVLRDRTVSLPQLRIEQPQDDAAVGIDHQHWVYKEGRIDAVSARAERGFAAFVLREVDLGGVLNRQHAASGYLRQQVRSRFGDQFRLGHSLITQKAPEGFLTRLVAAKPFNRHGPAQHHATEQLLPLFSQPLVPKRSEISRNFHRGLHKKDRGARISDSATSPPTCRNVSQHAALKCPRCVHPVARPPPDPYRMDTSLSLKP